MKNTEDISRLIAIVGYAGRFPQAGTEDEYWDNLIQKKDCFSEFPESRWSNERYFSPQTMMPFKSYCNQGGFIADIERFDNKFFNIPDDEVPIIDPKQRLFMEIVYSSLEHAGYNRYYRAGANVGVFAGSSYIYHAMEIPVRKTITPFGMMGASNTLIANRVSGIFDFKGPSVYVDTFCSSSLVAVHMACQSLLLQECEMAVAGGINILSCIHYISLSQLRAISFSGKCRPFDAEADGFVPGEGGGVVVLKRLDKALTDGDTIHAVIRGAAVNHTGISNNITSPNPEQQKKAIEDAYHNAEVDIDSISYIEAHGTGTVLGDPLEIKALKEAFRNRTDRSSPCYIGSVKGNIGHLEPASGIAGLIKVLLCLKHKKIPGIMHLTKLNRFINLEDTCFVMNKDAVDWKPERYPLRAGISSFGLTGTNIHMVIDGPAAYVGPGQAQSQDKPGYYRFDGKAHYFKKEEGVSQWDIIYSYINNESLAAATAIADPNGKEQSSPETFVEFVKKVISRKANIALDAFDLDTCFDSININSLMRIEISYEILSRFPVVEKAGDAFIMADSINDFITQVSPYIDKDAVAEPASVSGSTDVSDKKCSEILLGQRTNNANRLIDRPSCSSQTPFGLQSRLLVKEGHPFFFDHPLDHISGIQLIEAMLQAASLSHCIQTNTEPSLALFHESIHVQFINICPKTGEGSVSCEHLDFVDGCSSSLLYRTKVEIPSQLFCKANIRVSQAAEKMRSDFLPAAKKEFPEHQLCSEDLVNKRNRENIFISMPMDAGAGAGAGEGQVFRLRPVGNHPLFGDYSGSHIPSLYFLEAFRQTQRFMQNTRAPLVPIEQIRDVVLLSLSFNLDYPIHKQEAVFIQIEGVQHKQVGKNFITESTGIILKNGHCAVGKCHAQNMILTK